MADVARAGWGSLRTIAVQSNREEICHVIKPQSQLGEAGSPITVWLGTAYIFSAGILKGKHMSTVYIHKLSHASDLQISMKWVIRYISQIILVNEHIIAEPVVYSQFLLASLHT